MQSLTQRLWSQESRWHIGELAWLRLQRPEQEAQWRTCLWEHDEQIVAWAWVTHFRHLDLHLDPVHSELATEILRWFDQVGEGDDRSITLLDTETHLIETLKHHGYREQRTEPFFIHLRRGLEKLARPKVPDGYTLRPVNGDHDARARASVHRAAFSLPGQPPAQITADRYLQIMRTWPYRRELDWLIEAPDGTPAAFCLAWLDQHNHAAVLEPVGTTPQHRRLGLATAATYAALDTARRLGATSAYVSARGDNDYPSARQTYQSIGFRRFARNLSFTHDR